MSSLVVQWLGLCTFTAEVLGSISGWRTKIPQAMWPDQKKREASALDCAEVSFPEHLSPLPSQLPEATQACLFLLLVREEEREGRQEAPLLTEHPLEGAACGRCLGHGSLKRVLTVMATGLPLKKNEAHHLYPSQGLLDPLRESAGDFSG